MPGFFVIILVLYLVGNLYIFIRGWHTLSGLALWGKIIVSVIYWAISLLFFVSFRSRGGDSTFAHVLYEIGSSWLLFVLYMVVCLLVIDLLKLFKRRWKYSFYLAMGLTICVLIYGSYNYHHPKVKEINLTIDKPLSSPDKKLKIVAFSDVHLGNGTGKQLLQKYVALVNAQQPDLILIGGDLIDNDVTPLYNQHMEEELLQLQAPLGIYMVPGNHEYFGGGLESSEKFLELTSIVLLRDSLTTFPNGLQLLGRDDRRSRDRKAMAEWNNKINHNLPVIMLDHQPYDLYQTEEAGIDLQFSGHTHRGQIWPLNWIADSMFELSYGYKQLGNTHMYVSSGLSLWGPPFRIGTDSEIVAFNLTFK
ncbi:metallophosphoesterase [Parabacteroides sp. OttesenSCG-928-G07]|nr:metallophosphoesterase [Parabacteroides sp. OttesenSCG-928-G21]MDL2277198.1 metallophosphoesterase [Parabacteroides sp. OttesenSCG-928-G07]